MNSPVRDNQHNIPDNYPQHNFFLLIPSHVADDPDIDDSTSMLYGRLNALSNREGFCWASDQYLADLTKCKLRSIQERLNLLEKKGYIVRDTKKEGMAWKRKIYVRNDVKINLTNSATALDRIAPQRDFDQRPGAKEYDKDNNIKTDLIDSPNLTDPAEQKKEEKIIFKSKKSTSGTDSIKITELYKRLQEKGYHPDDIKPLIEKLKSTTSYISDIVLYSEQMIKNNRKKTYANNSKSIRNPGKSNLTERELHEMFTFTQAPTQED